MEGRRKEPRKKKSVFAHWGFQFQHSLLTWSSGGHACLNSLRWLKQWKITRTVTVYFKGILLSSHFLLGPERAKALYWLEFTRRHVTITYTGLRTGRISSHLQSLASRVVPVLKNQCRRCGRRRFDHWVGKISWRGAWQPTPVFLPGEFHGQRSLAGYSL